MKKAEVYGLERRSEAVPWEKDLELSDEEWARLDLAEVGVERGMRRASRQMG